MTRKDEILFDLPTKATALSFIMKRYPSMSQGTVWRALVSLVAEGKVVREKIEVRGKGTAWCRIGWRKL
jgi:hypothetical protein